MSTSNIQQMTDEMMSVFIKNEIDKIDSGGIATALSVAKLFSEAGFVINAHLGYNGEWTPRRTMEWYAGQLLSIVENESWFAMNSLVNSCEKFTDILKEIKCPSCGEVWRGYDEDCIMFRCECGYVVVEEG